MRKRSVILLLAISFSASHFAYVGKMVHSRIVYAEDYEFSPSDDLTIYPDRTEVIDPISRQVALIIYWTEER